MDSRSWTPRLWALALGLGIALAVAEVALRMLEPAPFAPPTLRDEDGALLNSLSNIVYELQSTERGERDWPSTYIRPHRVLMGCYDQPTWDYFDADGCVEYLTNAFGFRDDEFAQVPAPGELRLMALGDSFTFGLGVQHADTWTEALERQLRASTDGPVQVINAGFARGHMPTSYLSWLGSDGMAFEPEVIILGLVLNDMGDLPMLAGPSRADRGAVRVLSLLAHAAGIIKPLQDYAEIVRNHPGVWSGTRTALTRIQELADERGIRFVVAVFPMLSQLDGGYPFVGLHEMAVSFCREEGIEVVDLLPAFRGHDARLLWVHPTDQHPNDVRHALIAQALFRYLESSR
jgi:lysophospholipase L1-like esterase